MNWTYVGYAAAGLLAGFVIASALTNAGVGASAA